MLYATNGDILFRVSQQYESVFGHHNDVEQDTQTWRTSLVYSLEHVAEYARDNAVSIDALVVTSQRASVIPVDSDGNPLYNAVMWQDKRSIGQCEELQKKLSLSDMYYRTGLRVNPYFSLPKMMWLRDTMPEIYGRTHKLIGVQDYVIFLLTRRFVTDHSQACRTMLMNIDKFQWDEDMQAASGIPVSMLPDLVPPGSQAGQLDPGLATVLGLPSGIPVFIGGGDQQCAALSLGVLAPGDFEANTGTGSFVIAYSEKPRFHPECTTLCSAAAEPGKWIVEAGIFTTGLIHRWFKENFYPDVADAYDIMNAEVAESPIGANGVLMPPHFEGSAAPYWNPRAKGMFFNITMATKRSDLARAVIEGIALEIGHNITLLEGLDVSVNRVSIAGGLTSLDVFNQIQADVFGKPVVRYDNNEASSLGALMSACVSMGVYENYSIAFDHIVRSSARVYQPEAAASEKYKLIMNRKKELYRVLHEGNIYSLFS